MTANANSTVRDAQTPLRAHPFKSRLIEFFARVPTGQRGEWAIAFKQGRHGRFLDLRLWVERDGTLVPGKGVTIHESAVGAIASAFAAAARRIEGE